MTSKAVSPRELQVVRLVSQGLTNNEIAYELNICPKTVSKHLSNAFAKLYITNRTEAAVWYINKERDNYGTDEV